MAANQERDFSAEAARLLLKARVATLATISQNAPYAALVTPAVDADGSVLLLLSDLSAHTRHLRANPACALLIAGQSAELNPQTAPRVSLRAVAQLEAAPAAHARYLHVHPYAEFYSGFADFHFWRLISKHAHFVGGFAAAADLEIAALQHEIKSLLDAGYG
jgi:putative heme iron utilization protein